MHTIIRFATRFSAVFCLLCGFVPFVGYGIRNMGTIAMLLLGICFAVLPWLWKGPLLPHRRLRTAIAIIGSAGMLFCLLLSLLMARRAWFMRPPSGEAALVVLGAKINGNEPSLMLRRRLDQAATYLAQSPGTVCVVSGGQGADEDFPEALVMRDYLVQRGVSENRVIMEDRSRNTQENLQFSFRLLEENGVPLQGRVIIVTDGFHQLRASLFARAEGLSSSNLSSLTPWGLLPSYWLREMLGVCWAWLSLQFGIGS